MRYYFIPGKIKGLKKRNGKYEFFEMKGWFCWFCITEDYEIEFFINRRAVLPMKVQNL